MLPDALPGGAFSEQLFGAAALVVEAAEGFAKGLRSAFAKAFAGETTVGTLTGTVAISNGEGSEKETKRKRRRTGRTRKGTEEDAKGARCDGEAKEKRTGSDRGEEAKWKRRGSEWGCDGKAKV